ncbi:MAG: bacillithiol biosynthesis protein BshC, partial [Planctomycetota bacterium]
MIRSQFAADAWRGGTWPRAATAAIAEDACRAHAASPAQQQAAASLAEPDTVVVVTGQQPALGGGPLYTVIKAAQTVALAEALREQGFDCVPVFWCASEDHDAGEADHADLIHADGRVQRIHSRWTRTGASSRFQAADGAWRTLCDAGRRLPGQLGAAWLQRLAPREDEDLGSWCCRLLSRLFADSPLVCLQAHQLRPLWRDRIGHIQEHWPSAELAARRQALL